MDEKRCHSFIRVQFVDSFLTELSTRLVMVGFYDRSKVKRKTSKSFQQVECWILKNASKIGSSL